MNRADEGKPIKVDAEVNEHGDLKFNLYDLFAYLDDESVENLAKTYAWHGSAWKEIVKALREEHGTRTYNPEIYKARLAFFQMPIENEDDWDYYRTERERHVHNAMRDTMEALLRELATLKAELYEKESAIGSMYHFIKDTQGSGAAWGFMSKMQEFEKKSLPHEYAFYCGNEAEEQISYDEYIAQWVESMNEFFRKEMENVTKTE